MSLQSFDTLNGARQRFVPIKVKVLEVNRTFNLKFCQKTRIKEIIHKIAELLNLDPLRTNFIVHNQLGLEEMKPQSTLLQNQVQPGDTLIAKMMYTGYNEVKMSTYSKSVTKTSSFGNSPIETYVDQKQHSDYNMKTQTEILGLKLLGICRNIKCVTHGKKVTFPIGMGEFDLMRLLSLTKCHACKKAVSINGLSLTNCFWKVEGNYTDKGGFLNYKYMKTFNKTEGTDSTVMFDKLRETKFVNPRVVVKAF